MSTSTAQSQGNRPVRTDENTSIDRLSWEIGYPQVIIEELVGAIGTMGLRWGLQTSDRLEILDDEFSREGLHPRQGSQINLGAENGTQKVHRKNGQKESLNMATVEQTAWMLRWMKAHLQWQKIMDQR